MIHQLSVYQKPKLGNGFIKSHAAFNYRHRLNAVGWFDTASCDIAVSVSEGERILEQYIGNRIATYVDNPAEPIWEGFINRITYEYGSVIFTISLDAMVNKVRVTYSMDSIGDGGPSLTASVSNTESQAIYGIKDGLFDAQFNNSSSTSTSHKEAIRDRILNVQAWPKPSTSLSSGSSQPIVRLEMLGFYHTLNWDICTRSKTTNDDPDDEIIAMLASSSQLSNQDTFFDNADTTEIEENTGFAFPRGAEHGVPLLDYFKGILDGGDAINRWILGITPTSFNRGTRRFYYRQANTTVEYTTRVREPGTIYNLYGRKIPPWRVKPDRGIRLQDALIGWNLQGDDPREFYIEKVEYDGERQDVQLRSSDDITFEGQFQAHRWTRQVGLAYGQPPRNFSI